MWTNTAFNLYMGQYDAVTAAELEPALRREMQLGTLADSHHGEPVEQQERMPRFGLGALGLTARTAGRRLVRG